MAIRSYVGLLEAPVFRRVARALAQDGFRLSECTAAGLGERLRGPREVAVIIDPMLLPEDGVQAAIATLAVVPRAVAIFAPVTPDGITRALAFARHTTATVLFQAGDQDFQALSQSLVGVSDAAYARRLLAVLDAQVNALPARLRDAVRDAFLLGTTMETPTTLMRRAALGRRSLDRYLVRAGLGSVRLLAAAPQLLRAMTLLHETGLTVRRIAEIASYPSTRRLVNHSLELTGYTPAELRAVDEVDAVISTIASRLLRERGDAVFNCTPMRTAAHEVAMSIEHARAG
jgi:hypothetical protein